MFDLPSILEAKNAEYYFRNYPVEISVAMLTDITRIKPWNSQFHSRVNVMKILLNVLWISLVMLVAGCGGSDSNVDVAGDLDQQAKANYEAETNEPSERD